MAVQTVACPGCKATLKAPEQMAGKKAKCKKCGVSFRIPGGDEGAGDSAGESQFLSAMDLPAPAAADNPFDFGGEPDPTAKPVAKEKPAAKKSAEIPKAEPKPELPTIKPASKVVPKPPARKPKNEEEDEIPAAAVVEDEEPVAGEPVEASEPEPTASADPFAFTATPAPAKSKSKEVPKPKEEPKAMTKDEPKGKSKEQPKPGSKEEPRKADPARAKKQEDAAAAFSFGEDEAPKGLRDEPDSEDDDEDGGPVVEKSENKSGTARTYKSKRGSGGGNGGGGNKIIIAAVIFGVLVAGGIFAGIAFTGKDKQPEQAKNDDKKNPEAPPVTPGGDPPGKNDPPKVDPKEKDKGTTPPKKDPNPKKNPPVGGGPMLALPPGRTINFLPVNAKPEQAQEPSHRLLVLPTLPGVAAADAFAAARKVFPPLKKDVDLGVLWETAPGLQGAGQKFLLGIYSPQTGKQANQVAFDGDGLANPACDLSADANLFVHGNTVTNMVSVWDTRSNAKVLDNFNPYSDPKRKDLKLAAVYLTEPPKVFVTVSTTGAVHAFNVQSKEQMAGEFVPAKVSAKPLVAGKHIAPGPNHLSVIVYSVGSFYQVNIGPTVDGKEVVRLDGDVGQCFGISASGGGKMLFAFETDDKKDRAVMEVRGDGKHAFYRWPEKDAGMPVGAAWVDDGLAMVAGDKGSCVWFEAEGNDFRPIGLGRTPKDRGLHVASDGHWTLLPDPMNPKQCVLVEYSKPQSVLIGALDSVKTPPSAVLTDKSLSK